MKKTTFKIIIPIAVVVTIFLIIFSIFFSVKEILRLPPPPLPLEFTVEAWENEPTERFRMLSDLFDKYELVGLGKDEIISLLGEPRDIGTTYRCSASSDHDKPLSKSITIILAEENFLFYSLVDAPSPDYKRSLYIRLDENDIAINVYQVSLQT